MICDLHAIVRLLLFTRSAIASLSVYVSASKFFDRSCSSGSDCSTFATFLFFGEGDGVGSNTTPCVLLGEADVNGDSGEGEGSPYAENDFKSAVNIT